MKKKESGKGHIYKTIDIVKLQDFNAWFAQTSSW